MAVVIAIKKLPDAPNYNYERSRFGVVVSFRMAITGTLRNQSGVPLESLDL